MLRTLPRVLVKLCCSVVFLRGQGGFTLLEVILAMGILGIVGVAFMSTLNAGTKAVGTLDEQT